MRPDSGATGPPMQALALRTTRHWKTLHSGHLRTHFGRLRPGEIQEKTMFWNVAQRK